MTSNDLHMFKVKNINMHITYTPETQLVVRLNSLYDEPILSYGPSFGKLHRMTPNDLDMFKVKNTNMYATSTPGAQIFVRFTLQ